MTDLSKDELIERLRKALEEKNQQIKAAKFFTNISIIYNDFNNNVASQAEVEGLLNDALEGCGFDEDIAQSLVTYRNARKGEGAVIDTHDFAAIRLQTLQKLQLRGLHRRAFLVVF